jgi:hypothetical protein
MLLEPRIFRSKVPATMSGFFHHWEEGGGGVVEGRM